MTRPITIIPIAAINAVKLSTLWYPKWNFLSAGLCAILRPNSTIKEMTASDIESNPSAVATTLPLRIPVIISTIPIASKVTTEVFAIFLPAMIPSSTKLGDCCVLMPLFIRFSLRSASSSVDLFSLLSSTSSKLIIYFSILFTLFKICELVYLCKNSY